MITNVSSLLTYLLTYLLTGKEVQLFNNCTSYKKGGKA